VKRGFSELDIGKLAPFITYIDIIKLRLKLTASTYETTITENQTTVAIIAMVHAIVPFS
jgi:hypothetical protein